MENDRGRGREVERNYSNKKTYIENVQNIDFNVPSCREICTFTMNRE